MPFSRSKYLRILRAVLTIGTILIILGYAAWRSLPYARGPAIHIFEPVAGSTISSSTTVIIGRAERISSLTLDGYTISIDQESNFKETIVIFPGVNVITMDASDKFGRKTRTEVRVFGAKEF